MLFPNYIDLSKIEKNGFINYYSLKRFGNKSIPMHRIGRCILKANWDEAIKMILCQYDVTKEEQKTMKLYSLFLSNSKLMEYVNKDEITEALKILPHKEVE